MKFAVIDTRKQNRQNLGQIVSVHNSLAFAAEAAAGLLRPQGGIYPVIWRVAAKAEPGMAVPFAEVKWATPLSAEEYMKAETLIAEAYKRREVDPVIPRKITHHRRQIVNGVEVKKCSVCGMLKTSSEYYAYPDGHWEATCIICTAARRNANRQPARICTECGKRSLPCACKMLAPYSQEFAE
jgi:hypothetical protein